MTTITKLHLNGSDYDIGFNPENAGTTGDVLKKTASGYERGTAPATGIQSSGPTTVTYIWAGTEAQYNAIGTKNANTIYHVY